MSNFDIDKASADLVAAIKQSRGETTMSNTTTNSRDSFVVFHLESGNAFAIRASNVIAVLEKTKLVLEKEVTVCTISYGTGRATDPVATATVTDKMMDIVSTINWKASN